MAQTAASIPGQAAASGTVADRSGKPLAGAEVVAESKGRTLRATTGSDGVFHLEGPAGPYRIHAQAGLQSSAPSDLVLTEKQAQTVRLVVGTADAAGSGMEFLDKPDFTVAGVTDWTAVGGHGSDATLRTSEQLNREALALAANRAAGSTAPEMESQLRAAVDASPESEAPNRDLGRYYLAAGQFARAIPFLRTALRLGGGAPEDEYDLARALRGTGDLAGAHAAVESALAKRNAGDYHRLAGELDEQLGNPLAAVQQEEEAVRLDPSEENYFVWGTELLLHRAVWQAAEVFANGLEAYPASVRLRTARGAALFAGARYDDAAKTICQASDMAPSAREPYVFAGEIALASPTSSACLQGKLERFLALYPQDAQANYFNAMVLLRGAGPASQRRAEELLRTAVTIDPHCADAYLQLGILAAGRKDFPAAIALYRRAIDANPRLGEAHFRLGVAYDRTGDSAKAQEEYHLHEAIDAGNAAEVERQRREIKQFSVAPAAGPVTAQ